MNMHIDQTFKVAIYLRLSREDGDLSHSSGAKNESNSISNQRLLIYSFLKSHPELEVYGEYKDDGVSGSTFERADFQRMMDDIDAGKVNCVIVKDQSRFGRDYIEVGKYKEKIFPQKGVRFIAINEGYDSASASSSDDMAFTINSFVHDFYIRDISKKIRSHLETKMKNGEYTSNFVVFGYTKDPENKNKLIIDPYAAEIVRDIFSWKIEGLSPQNIANKLNLLGIPSPAEYKKLCGMNYKSGFQSEQRSTWSHGSVRRILRNEIYTGVTIQGKSTSPNYKTKVRIRKDESEWFRVEGTHEAIISIRDFKMVQELLREDTHSFDADGTAPVYGGRIFCGDCGAPAVRKTHNAYGRRYVYYVCKAHKQNKYVCSKHTIREDVLDQVVFETVKQHVSLLLDVDKALKKYESMSWEKNKIKKLEDNIAVQGELVQKNNLLRMGIYEDFKAGLLDRTEYDTLRSEITERIEDAEIAMDHLKQELRELTEGVTSQQEWIAQFRQYENISNLSRKTIMHLVERINVFEDATIEIVFRHQDQISEIMEFIAEQERKCKIITMPRLEVV